MDPNEQAKDLEQALDRQSTGSESKSLEFKSLRDQIQALENDLETNIKMKQQLELQLLNEEDPRRKAELAKSVAGLTQILDNHINEILNQKVDLETELNSLEYLASQGNPAHEISDPENSISAHSNQSPSPQAGEDHKDQDRKDQERKEQYHLDQRRPSSEVQQAASQTTQQPEKQARQEIQPNQNKSLLKQVILPVLAGAGILCSIGGYGYSHLSSQCNQELKGSGSQRQDLLQAKKVLATCQTAANLLPNNASTWKNAGRALLLTWSNAADESEKTKLLSDAITYFQNAVEKSNSKDPQSLFYKSFMEDFKEFVLEEKKTCSTSAAERYQESLNRYKDPSYQISEGDEFILLELSHFLIHRDGDSQGAVDLLNSVLQADPDPKYQNKSHKNILINKAKAETFLGNYLEAKNSLQEALKYDSESYKIRQDLASVLAQSTLGQNLSNQVRSENRKEAIAIYDQITGSLAPNVYVAWRNKGFLLYLDGNYSEAVNVFEQALSFTRAIDEFDQANAGLIKKYRDSARACLSGECSNHAKGALQKELKTRRIFSNNFITHDAVETQITDPFFSVEHDKFYQCHK